jgi:hypothetical protein
MNTINKIIEKIKSDREYIQKILIGGLLMFIPVVNIFALGYLYRYAGQVRSSGHGGLPKWEKWGRLFVDGVIFLGIILLYGFLPVLFGWAISEALNMVTLGFLGWVPYIPLSIGLLIAPSLTLIGVFSILKGEGFEGLFTKLGDHFKVLKKHWMELMLGNVAYIGFCIVGLPLYGFAHFIGLLLLIPYTLFVVKNEE